MNDSPARYLAEFHEVFDLTRQITPGPIDTDIAEVRQRLLDEETDEVAQAVQGGDLAEIAHELADVVYVAYGTALAYGIDLDAVLAEVHRANMGKLGPDGLPVVANGKVQKGPQFRAADVAAVLGLVRPGADT
ncbi:MAG TPA: MazG nucleotide pyrophosphohydrolase domain-containing protein [Actinocrinis sp.]|nr:MazG nucleotide pyrophosphohydrolase domain-containing protein [Actinocrinis sp.]